MTKQYIVQKIESIVNAADVVLFMKGEKNMPMCGFSGVVVQILSMLGVEFLDIDVLQDEEIRSGIKEYTNWPTIPQLYVKRQFVGGCDIIKEMYQNGELQQLLKENNLL